MSTEQTTYTYDAVCANCGNTFTESSLFGQIRPEKTICPQCGCLADTHPFQKPRFKERDIRL